MRNNKKAGITLIALVITILVLLILAGISITMIAGDNSILQRAVEAKKRTEEAVKKEETDLEVLGHLENKLNPRNTREYIMGYIEDEIYPKYEKYLKNNMQYYSEEEKNEAQYELEALKQFINNFDWDTDTNYPKEFTSSNDISKYPEGIYMNGYRCVPFFRNTSLESFKGIGFTKLNQSTEIKDVQPVGTEDNPIAFEKSSNNSLDIKIFGNMDLTNYLNGSELEWVGIYGDILMSLGKKWSQEEGKNIFEFKISSMNAESISQTGLNRRSSLLNNLLDIYISSVRMESNIVYYADEPIWSFELKNLFEQYLSRLEQMGLNEFKGSRECSSYSECISGFDEKTKELMKWIGLDYNIYKDYYVIIEKYEAEYKRLYGENYSNDFSKRQECENKAYKEFFEKYNISYYLSENGWIESDGYNDDENKLEKMDIIYNGKLYEGKQGMLDFIIDYMKIDTSNYTSKEEAIFEELMAKCN